MLQLAIPAWQTPGSMPQPPKQYEIWSEIQICASQRWYTWIVTKRQNCYRRWDSQFYSCTSQFFKARLALSQMKAKLSCQFGCEYETDSLPKCLNYNAENKANGSRFSPFKLVLVAGSEIENQEFHCSGSSLIGLWKTQPLSINYDKIK